MHLCDYQVVAKTQLTCYITKRGELTKYHSFWGDTKRPMYSIVLLFQIVGISVLFPLLSLLKCHSTFLHSNNIVEVLKPEPIRIKYNHKLSYYITIKYVLVFVLFLCRRDQKND